MLLTLASTLILKTIYILIFYAELGCSFKLLTDVNIVELFYSVKNEKVAQH